MLPQIRYIRYIAALAPLGWHWVRCGRPFLLDVLGLCSTLRAASQSMESTETFPKEEEVAAVPDKAFSDMSLGAQEGEPADTEFRLFIGDIPPMTTPMSLQSYFAQFGTVSHATVKHPTPGTSERTRSFGFITVVGKDVVQAIVTNAPPHVIDGHRVGTPEIAKHRQGERLGTGSARGGPIMQTVAGWDPNVNGMSRRAPSEVRKIFVGGLSHATKEAALSVRSPGP